MIAAKPASGYLSGFCGSQRHERCAGDYRTAVCSCPCHSAPPEPVPEVLGEIAAALTDLAVAAAVQHCPTCTCGGAV